MAYTENGNEIASHTYDHRNLATLNTAQLQWQFTQTAQKIQAFTGKYPALVRPPYGSYGTTVQQVSTVPLILWSIDTRDWQTRNTSSTVNCVLNQVKDGDIVLMQKVKLWKSSFAKHIFHISYPISTPGDDNHSHRPAASGVEFYAPTFASMA